MAQNFRELWEATKKAVFAGAGKTPVALRAAIAQRSVPSELDSLIKKIRTQPYRVTDEDLDALRSKYDEDQLFEIIVAASVAAADERLTAGLKALNAAREDAA